MELLRETVESSFRAPITTRYRSVFTENNPFIIKALSERYGLPADHFLCTTGATGAISLLYRTHLKPGDHVLAESPGFDIFVDSAEGLGVDVGLFRRPAASFQIDPTLVEAAMRPNTRLIVISNLHNPSGVETDNETLLALARIAERRDARVIVDEVYRDYVGPVGEKNTACKLSERLVGVSSLTKIYGLSALRCGWISAAPREIEKVRVVSEKFEFGVSKLAHAVAAVVLENREKFDRYTHGVIAEARPLMAERFTDLQAARLLSGVMPEHGCIFFPKVVGVADTQHLCDWLTGTYGLIVAPGEYFGLAGHIRIGFAHEQRRLVKGLELLTEGLTAYRDQKASKVSAG